METRAKLKCIKNEPTHDQQGSKISEQISFQNSYNPTDTPEDNNFSKYTPFAAFSMSLTNEVLFDNFEVGKSYYFDIIPCE